jgi:hypothetical protein
MCFRQKDEQNHAPEAGISGSALNPQQPQPSYTHDGSRANQLRIRRGEGRIEMTPREGVAMRTVAILLSGAVCFGLGLSAAQDHTYVGAQICRICHRTDAQGRQYQIWEASKHSQSFAALSSPGAAEKAKAAGVTNPSTSPVCLKCHAPLHEKAPALESQGVTCEVCHGPGSDYKSIEVMRNKAEAVKNGLVLYGSPAAIKAWCLTCHEVDHNVPFDFDKAWATIKHPIPKS